MEKLKQTGYLRRKEKKRFYKEVVSGHGEEGTCESYCGQKIDLSLSLLSKCKKESWVVKMWLLLSNRNRDDITSMDNSVVLGKENATKNDGAIDDGLLLCKTSRNPHLASLLLFEFYFSGA